MIESIDNWISICFVAIVVVTILFFFYANSRPKKVLGAMICYAIFQSILAYIGFYQDTHSIPPRLALVFIPTVFFIVLGIRNMPWVMENRNTKISTFLHVVRIPVEIILFQLFVFKMLPIELTYEGRNYDILMGASALVVGSLYYFDKLNKKALMVWNVIGLFMVLFIFFNAVFAVDSPIQLFGFDQPNKAVLYFPFILLPSIVVPIVVYTHITDILKLKNELVAES